MSSLDSESLRYWTTFEEIGFWLVIIGVAGESAELVAKLIAWWLKKHITQKGDRCLLVIEAAFWIMLIVGLVMEFRGASHVRTMFEAENTQLNFRASQLDLSRVELERQVKALEQTNLVMKSEVANVLKQTLAMRQNVAPFTEQELRSIRSQMTECGRMKIWLELPGYSKFEPHEIHQELSRLFTGSDWEIQPGAKQRSYRRPELHVLVISKQWLERDKGAHWECLNRIFNRLHVYREWAMDDSFATDELVICIKSTPPFQH